MARGGAGAEKGIAVEPVCLSGAFIAELFGVGESEMGGSTGKGEGGSRAGEGGVL